MWIRNGFSWINWKNIEKLKKIIYNIYIKWNQKEDECMKCSVCGYTNNISFDGKETTVYYVKDDFICEYCMLDKIFNKKENRK